MARTRCWPLEVCLKEVAGFNNFMNHEQLPFFFGGNSSFGKGDYGLMIERWITGIDISAGSRTSKWNLNNVRYGRFKGWNMG